MDRKALNLVRLALALTSCHSALGSAQMSEGGWRPFMSVTPFYLHDADLRDGGNFSVRGASLRVGVNGPIAPGRRAGVTLAYDRTDFDFSNPVAFGGRMPWNVVERVGISVPFTFALDDGWGLGVIPSVDTFREPGADTSKSLTKGVIVSAAKRYADGDHLGFGIGVFDGLERTRVFPFVRVDLALNDRWRLMNPLPAGPTGPAGLEVNYRFDDDWRLGAGVALRVLRFRLNADNAIPNGIGEERAAPLFLHATRNFGRSLSLGLYAGTLLGGRLLIEDENGNKLNEAKFSRAPFVSATLSMRF